MTKKSYDQSINELNDKLKKAFETIEDLENRLRKLERQHITFGPKDPYKVQNPNPFNSDFYKEYFKDLNNDDLDKFKVGYKLDCKSIYKSEGGTAI